MARSTDEIIEEIHEARRQHAERFGFDANRILDDWCAGQARHVAQGWPVIKADTLTEATHELTLRQQRLHHHLG